MKFVKKREMPQVGDFVRSYANATRLYQVVDVRAGGVLVKTVGTIRGGEITAAKRPGLIKLWLTEEVGRLKNTSGGQFWIVTPV